MSNSSLNFVGVFFDEENESKIYDHFFELYKKTQIAFPDINQLNRTNKGTLHMTVLLGKMPLHLSLRGDLTLYKDVVLTVNEIGVSNDAIAFGVSGYMSINDKQHITLYFNKTPSQSKDIINWFPLKKRFTLNGTIKQK